MLHQRHSFFLNVLLLLFLLLCVFMLMCMSVNQECMQKPKYKFGEWTLYFSFMALPGVELRSPVSLPTEPFHQPHQNSLAFTFVSFDQVLPCFQSSVWPTGSTFNGSKPYSIHSRYVFSSSVRIMKERHSHAAFNNTHISLHEILRSIEDRSSH